MNIACIFMVSKGYAPEELFPSDVNASAAIAIFLGWFYLLLFLQRYIGALEFIMLLMLLLIAAVLLRV